MFENINKNEKIRCAVVGKLKCALWSALNSHAAKHFFLPSHIVHLLFEAVWQEGRSPGGSALLRLYLLIALEQAACLVLARLAYGALWLHPGTEETCWYHYRPKMPHSSPMSWAENLFEKTAVDIICHHTCTQPVPFLYCSFLSFISSSVLLQGLLIDLNLSLPGNWVVKHYHILFRVSPAFGMKMHEIEGPNQELYFVLICYQRAFCMVQLMRLVLSTGCIMKKVSTSGKRVVQLPDFI